MPRRASANCRMPRWRWPPHDQVGDVLRREAPAHGRAAGRVAGRVAGLAEAASAGLWRGPTRGRLPARQALAAARFAAGLLLLGGLGGSIPAQAAPVPSFAEVRAGHRPSDVQVLDRHGQPLQTLRTDPHGRRLAWLPLQEISPSLRLALVLGEDQRFWEHSGVDWAALAGSAWAAAFDGRTRGASTLTMQLAGLVDPALARPAGGRSLGAKLGQVSAAQALEGRWRKSEILEAYLNLVPLRGELVGVNAGSQTLFGKHASGLDLQESALMAALVRAPNAEPRTVARRACQLLTRMKAPGVAPTTLLPAAPCQGLDALAELALQRRGGPALGEQLAPHAARWLAAQAPAAAGPLHSTLDAPLQRAALQALREQLAALRGRQVEDGAVLVLDNASGEVLAWVGSSGEFSQAASVDAVLARRQPGSTLKPFLYALAFERRLITPASLLHDAPTQLAAGNGLYLPQNYDRHYQGWVTARTALAASLNIPAVQVGAMLGPEAMFERLNAFGLKLSETAGFHGYALALGSAEVTLADLANAYRTLANGGRWSPWRLQPAPPGAAAFRTVADPRAVFQATDILADNSARALTFGLDSPLVTRGFAAVKTGTSKDMRDNWCIGFTDRYTVAVWVGNAGGAPMQQVSGTSGAAPVWRTLVQRLHQGQPSRPPAPPAGLLAVRGEWFAQGTAPLDPRPNSQASAAPGGGAVAFGIRSPLDGSVFALDPDIPPAQQRIVLEGEPGTWLLNGRPLGRTTAQQATLPWAPWPGRHQLVLKTTDGRLLPPVRFEVRGAQVKRG